MPRMLLNLNKIVKEEASNRLNTAISEAIGELVLFIIVNIENKQEQTIPFKEQLLKFVLAMISKKNGKSMNNCGMLCITKIILNSPKYLLEDTLDTITNKLAENLRLKSYQNKQDILECLIQSVTFLKANFDNYFEKYEDCILEIITSN